MKEETVVRVKTQRLLDNVVRDWSRSLGSRNINTAMSITRSPNSVTIVTESGDTIQFVVS